MYQFVPSKNHLISKIIEGIHLQLCPQCALIEDPPHPSGANRIQRVDVVLFCYFTCVYMNHSRIWDVDEICMSARSQTSVFTCLMQNTLCGLATFRLAQASRTWRQSLNLNFLFYFLPCLSERNAQTQVTSSKARKVGFSEQISRGLRKLTSHRRSSLVHNSRTVCR